MTNVTVVVPVYNKKEYINQVVKTIYSQKRLPDEVIFIDDSSTDGSLLALQQQQVRYHFRILTNKTNLGVSATRNKGIKAAANQYVALLDCDDLWHPDFLSKMLEVLAQDTFHLLGSGYSFKFQDKETLAKFPIEGKTVQVVDDYFQYAVTGDLPFTCSSVILDKDAFLSCGAFQESYAMGEDQLLWNNFILKGYNCAVINEALAYYIIDANNSACNNNNKSIVADFLYKMVSDSSNFSSKYKSKYIKKHLIYAFVNAIRSGNRQAAVKVIQSSLISIDLVILFQVVMLIPLSLASKCCNSLYKILDRKRG